jgi:hypothetical protein
VTPPPRHIRKTARKKGSEKRGRNEGSDAAPLAGMQRT